MTPSVEYRATTAMLAPIARHFLIAPLIADDRVRFDLLDDSAYHGMLSSGERAIVDLARGFWNGAPTENTFGSALRRLDITGLEAFASALDIWMKGITT